MHKKILFFSLSGIAILIAILWYFIPIKQHQITPEAVHPLSNVISQVQSSIGSASSVITQEQAGNMEGKMEDLALRMINPNQRILFEEMYYTFRELKNYQDYQDYIKKYPELLPPIYAVRLEDKDVYLKFYDFVFDKILDEGIYINDIKNLVGDLEEDELKKGFLKILGDHYNDIVNNSFSFSSDFGDGPLHIAMTNDTLEIVKNNCIISHISGINERTKQECYNYAYQFRASKENKFCEKIEGSDYQKYICKGFLEYTFGKSQALNTY